MKNEFSALCLRPNKIKMALVIGKKHEFNSTANGTHPRQSDQSEREATVYILIHSLTVFEKPETRFALFNCNFVKTPIFVECLFEFCVFCCFWIDKMSVRKFNREFEWYDYGWRWGTFALYFGRKSCGEYFFLLYALSANQLLFYRRCWVRWETQTWMNHLKRCQHWSLIFIMLFWKWIPNQVYSVFQLRV